MHITALLPMDILATSDTQKGRSSHSDSPSPSTSLNPSAPSASHTASLSDSTREPPRQVSLRSTSRPPVDFHNHLGLA